MPRGRPKAELTLTDDERQTLKTWAARPKSSQQLAQRARIVLACADGAANKVVAVRLGITTQTVGKWRKRFLEQRLDGLADQPRPGAPRKVTDEDVEQVITRTLETKPRLGERMPFMEQGGWEISPRCAQTAASFEA